MKKTAITIEALEKRINWDNGSYYKAFDNYLDFPIGDPSRPDKEVAIWFLRNLHNKSRQDNVGSANNVKFRLIKRGYLTLAEMLSEGFGELLVNNRSYTKALLTSLEQPFPLDPIELERLLDKQVPIDKKEIAKSLLCFDFSSIIHQCSNEDLADRAIAIRQKKAYVEFMNACYFTLLKAANAGDRYQWQYASYVPSSVIINKFKGSIAFGSGLAEVGSDVDRHMRIKTLPYEQIVDDFMPFFATLPMATKAFPWCVGAGTPGLITALGSDATSLSVDETGRRLKVYNAFIKPLFNNPQLLKKMLPRDCSLENTLSNMASIAGAVVPASELMMFVERVLFVHCSDIGGHYLKRSLLELIANVKTVANLPVTKDFIKLQIELDVYDGYVCYNNECINDVNFWSELVEDRKGSGSKYLFSESLGYNRSFQRNFKIKIEDFPFYVKNKRKIRWNAFSNLDTLPREFLITFCEQIYLSRLDRKVLKTFDEEMITAYLNVGANIPYTFFEENNNLSVSFLAKNALKLFVGRGSVGNKETKLDEMIAALA